MSSDTTNYAKLAVTAQDISVHANQYSYAVGVRAKPYSDKIVTLKSSHDAGETMIIK